MFSFQQMEQVRRHAQQIHPQVTEQRRLIRIAAAKLHSHPDHIARINAAIRGKDGIVSYVRPQTALERDCVDLPQRLLPHLTTVVSHDVEILTDIVLFNRLASLKFMSELLELLAIDAYLSQQRGVRLEVAAALVRIMLCMKYDVDTAESVALNEVRRRIKLPVGSTVFE